MKLNTDSFRAGISELVKAAGYGMGDMERYVTGQMPEAEMQKFAFDTLEVLKSLITLPAMAAAGTGAAGGLAAYGAFNGLRDSQERVNSKQKEVDAYREARERLLASANSGIHA